MSAKEAYSLAHTARCKLNLAANRPDRNLRFVLGHAFTFDKLMLRIAEIESDSSGDDDEITNEEPVHPKERRISFQDNSNRPTGELRQEAEPGNGATNARRRSPPPDRFAHLDDTDSDSSNDEYYEDDEGDELGLQKFGSAAAQPPRIVQDESSSSDDDDEPKSPPTMPSEAELRMITEGEANEDLQGLYQMVAACPCHGENGPAVHGIWDLPQKKGQTGPRLAVIQIET